MSRIKLRNFGPIKGGMLNTDGWLDIKKVTVFIGNQGSGKSTIAKLISTLTWIEKVLTRGDFNENIFTSNKFKNTYCGFHRLNKYFVKNETEIQYEGDSYSFTYNREGNFIINKKEYALNIYPLPQIMYVPAERNLLSIVDNPELFKDLPDNLVTFTSEYNKAKKKINGSLKLPINDTYLEYNKHNGIVSIKGHDYKIKLLEASSGFQAFVPLYLVTWFLSESVKEQANKSNKMSSDETKQFEDEVKSIWSNKSLSDEQRRIALSVLSARFNKSAFINIVEEPELNLYPSSQYQVMQSLLSFNNMIPANKLVITTHSPYLINDITLAVKASLLRERIYINTNKYHKLNSIYPLNATIRPDELAIYELDEKKGSISLLSNYRGLPSDENYLNDMLDVTNNTFADMLEFEQQL